MFLFSAASTQNCNLPTAKESRGLDETRKKYVTDLVSEDGAHHRRSVATAQNSENVFCFALPPFKDQNDENHENSRGLSTKVRNCRQLDCRLNICEDWVRWLIETKMGVCHQNFRKRIRS